MGAKLCGCDDNKNVNSNESDVNKYLFILIIIYFIVQQTNNIQNRFKSFHRYKNNKKFESKFN